MQIKLFGMKARVELLVLIGLLGLYLGSTMLCSCMRYEGMSNIGDCNTFSSLKGNKGPGVPLPEGEMLIFKGDRSSPECCPATYSTSQGCLCITEDQMEYLNERGGNRTLAGAF